MNYANRIELEISGERALFSEPLLSMGGGRVTLPVPTYGALRGILRSVYYKPTIEWYPEELRVMNIITTDLTAVRRLRWSGGDFIQSALYLNNVRYRLRAHFAWNAQRPDLAPDRNEHRHFQGALRMALGLVYCGRELCGAYPQALVMNGGVIRYEAPAFPPNKAP